MVTASYGAISVYYDDMCEAIEDFDEVEKLGQGFSSADPLEEIDIGDGITPRPTFVNKNMSLKHKDVIIKLLRDYIACFTRNYREMPGLSRELVEHRLPIKSGFMPYKQPAQRFNLIIHDQVKEEMEQLLDVGFIRPCRYAEWVFNIVPIEKKNTDKFWVCVDFHNLNKAPPKDEYPMPIADMIINNASVHREISFLDDNAGYNQIFMVEKDMSKMALCCPDFIGLFEWVVMTFGSKMPVQHIKGL
jgi:hypothetical protein